MHIIRELLSVLAQAGDGLSGPRSQRQLEPASASVRAESAPARQRRIAGGLLCLLAMLAGPAMAADWYASPSGAGTQDCMSAANACKGIQAAINKAGTYDTVHVAQGNYAFTNDRVVINTEGLKLIGDSSPFAAPYGSGAGQVAPGTLGNKAANASVLKAASAAAASGGASGMIWVRNVKNVRIENLYVEVDSSGSFDFSCFCTIVKAKEAIVASGTVNGLQLVNNYIKITGGTGAIAIGINVLATSDSSVPASEARQSGQFVTIDGNVIEPTSSPAAAPKRAIAMENQVGLIARNQLAGTTQDLWVQYANASGSAPAEERLLTIEGNWFFGKLQIYLTNGYNLSGPIGIRNNHFVKYGSTFSPPGLPSISLGNGSEAHSLRVMNGNPTDTLIEGNEFKGFSGSYRAVWVQNRSGVVIQDNVFTPDPGQADFTAILVGNRDVWSGISAPAAFGVTILRNTFNANGATSGNKAKAILFVDDNDPTGAAPGGALQVGDGTLANANKFDAGIGWYIALDDRTCSGNNHTGSGTCNGTSAYAIGEGIAYSGGSSASSQKRPFKWNVSAAGNSFGGVFMPDMDQAQYDAVWAKTFDNHDKIQAGAAVGNVVYDWTAPPPPPSVALMIGQDAGNDHKTGTTQAFALSAENSGGAGVVRGRIVVSRVDGGTIAQQASGTGSDATQDSLQVTTDYGPAALTRATDGKSVSLEWPPFDVPLAGGDTLPPQNVGVLFRVPGHYRVLAEIFDVATPTIVYGSSQFDYAVTQDLVITLAGANPVEYDGTVQALTFDVSPASNPGVVDLSGKVALAYNGSAAQSNAGAYAVTATAVDADYVPQLASTTFTISPAPAAVTWSALQLGYTGSMQSVMAGIVPQNTNLATVTCAVSPSSFGPQVGSYPLAATCPPQPNLAVTGSMSVTATIGGSTAVRRTHAGSTEESFFATIADALSAGDTVEGDTLEIAPGTYSGPIVLTKGVHLVGSTGYTPSRAGPQPMSAGPANPPAVTIDGGGALAVGITVANGVKNAAISGLHVLNFTQNCIAANQGNDGLQVFDNVVEHCGNRGIYVNGIAGIRNVAIHNNVVSDTGDRAISIWNGFKRDITVADNLITNAGTTGIALDDGKAAGIVITGNEIHDSGDAAITAIQLTGSGTPGDPSLANLIAGNTITNPGRFGISLMIPNGTGSDSGDGAIVVENNDITGGAGLGGYPSDRAGISVVRRYWSASQGQVDATAGVVIRSNAVGEFNLVSPGHEAYGIVVEGTGSSVYANTLDHNQFGLQIQQGNPSGVLPPGNSAVDVSDVSDWFDRGNAPLTCVSVGEGTDANTFTNNATERRDMPLGAAMTGGVVTNVNTGAHYCSITAAVAAAQDNDTISVAAGVHAENVVVTRSKVKIIGANAGMNAGVGGSRDGTGAGETILVPATAENGLGLSSFGKAVIKINADDVTLDGFVIDTDNTAIDSGVNLNGAGPDVSGGIYANGNRITLTNLVVRNAIYAGIDGGYDNGQPAQDGSVFSNNRLTNCDGTGYGVGIALEQNFYAQVTGNRLDAVRTGIQLDNNWQAAPTAGYAPTLSNNQIQAKRAGIWANLFYQNASTYHLVGNTIMAAGGGAGQWSGIWIESMQDAQTIEIASNTIDGSGADAGRMRVGYLLNNIVSSAASSTAIDGGGVSNVDVGVLATDATRYTGPVNDFVVRNVDFVSVTRGALYVEDTTQTPGSARLSIGAGNIFGSNVAHQLVLSGAAPVVSGAVDEVFVRSARDFVFGAVVSSTGNPACASNSAAPFCAVANASINAGIAAVSSGGTVNVEDGSFAENVNVNKSVTLRGPFAGIHGHDGARGTGEAVVSPATGVGVLLSAANVTVDGLTIRSGGGHAVQRNPGSAANNLRLVNNRIENVVNGSGVFSEPGATAGTGDGFEIAHNRFAGISGSGASAGRGIVLFKGTTNAQIDDNDFDGIAQYAMQLNAGNGAVSNVAVTGNRITNTASNAIVVTGASGVSFLHNTISGVPQALYFSDGTRDFTAACNVLSATGSALSAGDQFSPVRSNSNIRIFDNVLSGGTVDLNSTMAQGLTIGSNWYDGAPPAIGVSATGLLVADPLSADPTNDPHCGDNTPVSIVAYANTSPQSRPVDTAFNALRARVQDVLGGAVTGQAATFMAPGSGASASLGTSVGTTNYNGEVTTTATANSVAGSYNVTASSGALSAGFALTNTQGTATVTVASASVTYDGNPRAVTVGTTPAGLESDVQIVYTQGAATVATCAATATGCGPVNAGVYTATATIVGNDNYTGSGTGTLTIMRAPTTIEFQPDPLTFVYDGNTHMVTARLHDEPGTNCAVTGTVGPNVVGSPYAVDAAACTGANYTAPANSTTAQVTAQPMTIMLSHLTQAYDGSPKSVVVTTSPTPNVSAAVTYNGNVTPPTAEGSYNVAATVTDPNYSGSASGTLHIVGGNGDIALVLNGPVDPIHVGDTAQYAATMLANPALHAGEHYGYRVVLTKSGGSPLALSDLATMDVFYQGQWVDATQYFGAIPFTLDPVASTLTYDFPDGVPGYASGFPIEDPSWTWNFRFSFASEGTYTTTATLVQGIGGPDVDPPVMASIATVVEAALPPTDIHLVLGGPAENIEVGAPAEYTGTMLADPSLHAGEDFFVKVIVGKSGGQALVPSDIASMEIYYGGTWQPLPPGSFTQPDGAGTDLVYLFPQPAGAFPIQDAQWTWNFRITYADQGTYTATAQVIPGYQGNLANPDVLASAAISTNVVPAVVVPPTANLILLGPVEDVQAHMPAEYTGTLVADPAQFPGSYLMRVRLSRAGGTMTPADLEKMELYNGGWSDETLGIRGVMVQDGDDVLYYFPQPAASSFPITSSVWSWHFRFTYADVGEYTAVADLIDSADPSPENAASFAHAQLSTHVVAQAADIHLQLQGPVTGVVGQPAQYVGSLTADPLPAASELFYVKVRLHKSTGAMDVSDLSKMEILQGGTWYDATTELQGQFANDGNDLVYYFPQPNGAFPIDGDWSWQFRFTYADAAVYTATAQVVHESGLTPASDPVSISTDVAPEPPAVALQLNGPVAGVQVNEPAAYIGQLTNTGAALDENAYVNVDITLDGGATPLQPGDVDVEVWDGSAWVPGSLASDGNNGLTVDFPDASGFAIPANFDFTHQFRITYHVPGVFHATAAVLGADNLPQVTYATAEMFTEVVAHSPVTVQVLIDPASLHVAYDGNTHAATATTLPAVGHPLVFSYNGSTDLPSDAGIYSVVASVSPDDAPYVGSASAILLIDKAPGTITFAPLSGPFGSAHTVNASLDQDSLASCTVTGVPAANAAPGNYAISATCASNNYSAVGTATYVVTASTASIIAVGSAPVGVVAVDPQPGADAKKTSFTWKTTGSANEFVRASFVIAANGTAQAGDLALEYFETANGTWQPLPLSFSGGQWTGAFGPASGFPLVDGATSQFRATFHKGGRYTTTASLVGAGSGLVLATSASLATDVAEIGLTGIANEAGHVGQAVETAMTLSNTGTAALSSGLPAGNPIPAQPAPNDENVRGRFVITWNGGALAPADTSGPGGNCGAESCASPDVGIEYYDAATGTYRPIYNLRQSADGESLYGYFGALGNGGVPVPAAFSGSNLFHTTFKRNTGTYTVTWQVVGISTGTVYAQAPAQTIGIDTGTAASIAIVSGDGGTATVGGNAYDAGDLVVEVRDIGGNPVANAAVAFNAQPGNGGAGATFAAPAVTGVDGRTAIHALSNDFAGVFAVGASLSNGVALAQPFALENVADFDASQVRIALVSGDGQTAQVGTDYALPLLAKVTDRFGNAVAGFDVAFFVNGVGATLANDSGTTDANGLVDSGTVTASGTAGVVAVEARIDTAQCDAGSSDATCAVEFDLTNTAGGASSIALASLVNSAEVGTIGAYTLTANVHDANGNAVAGVSVTMIGPSAGAGIAPALHTVTTDTFGQATHTFDANHVAGAFQVQAVASGANVASVALENEPGMATKIVRASGDGQSTPVGSAFGEALAVRVLDAWDNPVADDAAAVVSFVAPANGASAAVPATVTSGAGGLASTAATANGTAGNYSVMASFNGHDVAFALTNTVGAVTISDVVWTANNGTTIAYDGSAKSATATVTGSSLTPTFTYNGSTTAPSAAGSYQVIATIDDGNVHGTASAMLTITPAGAGTSGITLSGGAFTYDGGAKPATVVNPNGVAYTLAYDSADGLPPINAGTYTATLTIDDANHMAETLTASITIDKAIGTVNFSATNATFDGNGHSIGALIAQEPANGTACTLTPTGEYPRVNAGSTMLAADCDGTNYAASGSTTMFVSPKPVTIALSGLGSFPYTGTAHAATATVAGEVSGYAAGTVVTYTPGGANAPVAVGSYEVVATLDAASTNYTAPAANGTILIGAVNASVTLGNLSQVYDGTPRAATATTDPAGLAVDLTYDGSMTAPTDAGTYTVVATITAPGYSGSASGTLVVAKKAETVTLDNLSATYDGGPHAATATTTPDAVAVAFTYDGSATAPTNAGSYAVVATVTDANHTGSASGTLTIAMAPATVTLTAADLHQVYGATHAVGVTTDPAGLSIDVTYDGSTDVPTAVGSYSVVAMVTDANHVGSASGTLVVGNGAAQAIAANGGTAFTGTAGQPLAGALPSVKVTDAGGNPVAGVAVTFAAATGNGTLSGATQATDQNGIATLGGWTLDATPGQNTVIASAIGVTGTVTFTADGAAAGGGLGVTLTDGRTATQVGRELTYTITVGNGGSSNVGGVHVVDTLPAELDAATAHWQCIAVNGATCTASGTGNLDQTVDLPAGSSVVVLLTATVIGEDADGMIRNTLAVTSGSDTITRTDDDVVVLFRDGFELGGDGSEPWPAGIDVVALGTLDGGRALAVAVDAAQLGSLQRVTLAQAGDGAFRVEAIRIDASVYVRLVARTAQGEAASDWSVLDGSDVALVLDGAHLGLVGAKADLGLTLAQGGTFAVGGVTRH